jgi:hypothetical protein
MNSLHTVHRAATALAIGLASILSTGCGAARHSAEPLTADRPDFTEGADVVGTGVTQAEGGSSWSRVGAQRQITVGEGLVRVGTSEQSEFRIGVSSLNVTEQDGRRESRLGDPSLGAKVLLVEPSEEHRLLHPAIAIVAGTTLPAVTPREGARHLEPELKLAVGWALTPRIGLGMNANVAWPVEADVRYREYATSASMSVSITEGLGAYLEYYNSIPRATGAGISQVVNTGLNLHVSPNLQLDGRVGFGGASGSTGPFFGFGIARRW